MQNTENMSDIDPLTNVTLELECSILDKHKKYAEQYGKNTIYWGLGLENEVYLECEKRIPINMFDFLTKWTRERYSVDYFSNYKADFVKLAMYQVAKVLETTMETVDLPILLKSHSFTKMDINGEHETLLSKNTEQNPHFSGKTFLDILTEIDPEYFLKEENERWMFDGDTIEFFTRQFYNVTLDDILQELAKTKRDFEKHLNNALVRGAIFQEYGPIYIMKTNHPFATYMSNPDNIAMFNNGTLHFNLTLPTELDEHGEIRDWSKFEEQHCRAIRLIQWLEPVILAVYGSPDPFSKLGKPPLKQAFSAASQRCAISRYIGIGTYDTDKMPKGKILVKSVDEIYPKYQPKGDTVKSWYREYYRDNGYTSLSEIGMDINFNKHYRHGIEVRFLDHIDDPKDLANICQFFIYLMDHVLDQDFLEMPIENPAKSQCWHTLLVNIMCKGKTYVFTREEYNCYCQLFGIPLYTGYNEKQTVKDVYEYLFCFLENRYQKEKEGGFSSLTLPKKSALHLDHYVSSFIEDGPNIFITQSNKNIDDDDYEIPLSPILFQQCAIL